MNNRLAIFAAIATLASSACASNGSTAPSAPGIEAPAPAPADAATHNVSGQYTGTVDDSQRGTANASADLAQYQGAVGGTLTAIGGTASGGSVAAWVLGGTALTGRGVGATGSQTCTFAESATYQPSRHRLNGSYHAIHGCNGDSGTFALKQHCFYARNGGVGPETGGLKPC